MSGEDYQHDAEYVPEDPNFAQKHPNEHEDGNVISAPPKDSDEPGVGNMVENSNCPQNAEYVPEDANFVQEHPDEHDADAGNVVENSSIPHNDSSEVDVGNMVSSPPKMYGGHGAEDDPKNSESSEKHLDEQDYGQKAENTGSPQKRGRVDNSGVGEIRRWPGWPGENVFRMLVPIQKVGSIIGRKGEFIKKITEETKARIKILDGPPGTSERAVMVSAKEEPDRSIPPAMDGLLRIHKQIINLDQDPVDVTLGAGRSIITRLLVADSQAGSLIGKQGSTIKSIQDGSGCAIRVLGSEHLPLFALRDDSIVEIQGEPSGVHKAVELIASQLRKFLVDRSIVGVFEMQMQKPDLRVNQNVPSHHNWGLPAQEFPNNAGSGPSFAPNHQYLHSSHQYDNFYPPADMPPMDKALHQGPPVYGRDNSLGVHSSSVPSQQAVVAKVTHHMQIPLSYADAVIGTSGANISYIRRASGASIAIQETRGVPGQMTVEISGTASQIQAAQQLVQNFMAEAGGSTQDPMGASNNQGYNPYPANAPVYGSPPPSTGGHAVHAPAADYGPVYGANYGY